jgi:microcystin-dependent protein
MAEPYIAEIKMFGGNFAPLGYAMCDGQILAISQNDVLFALIGTTYGGDGQTTFALPDMRGRLPVHWGQGPGLSFRDLGEMAGTETVTLTTNQIPNHSHPLLANAGAANSPTPVNSIPANDDIYVEDVATTQFANTSIANAGGSQPHSNMMPYLCVNFIIAMEGIFPPRS